MKKYLSLVLVREKGVGYALLLCNIAPKGSVLGSLFKVLLSFNLCTVPTSFFSVKSRLGVVVLARSHWALTPHDPKNAKRKKKGGDTKQRLAICGQLAKYTINAQKKSMGKSSGVQGKEGGGNKKRFEMEIFGSESKRRREEKRY